MTAEEIIKSYLTDTTLENLTLKEAIIKAMKQYAKLKCEEQRMNCAKAYCDDPDTSNVSYSMDIIANAPEPKFD